jgi:cytochrome c oxidase subunit II
MLDWLSLPVAASAHAGEVDRIMALVHWLMVVLFVGWSIFFVYVLFRFRSGAHPKADYRGVRGGWSNWVEGGVLIAEIVLLAFFSIPFWTRNVDAAPPQETQATVVRVVAEQFAWNVHYPGADGKFGRTDIKLVSADNPLGLDRNDADAKDDLTDINQLHVPVNRPVLVHLTSKDVIHSFGLYEMRIKQDAVPGLEIPVWFVPTVTTAEMRTRTGKADFDYEIACSQLCGLGHFRMRGYVVVQSDAEYAAWTAEQVKALAK